MENVTSARNGLRVRVVAVSDDSVPYSARAVSMVRRSGEQYMATPLLGSVAVCSSDCSAACSGSSCACARVVCAPPLPRSARP